MTMVSWKIYNKANFLNDPLILEASFTLSSGTALKIYIAGPEIVKNDRYNFLFPSLN